MIVRQLDLQLHLLYLCNQWLSLLKLWVRTLFMVMCTRYIMWSLSVTYNSSVFSLGTPVSYTNKTDHHKITVILLKVVLSTINLEFIYDDIQSKHGINCGNIALQNYCTYNNMCNNVKLHNLIFVVYLT